MRHLQLESRNGVKYPACLYTPQDQIMGTTTKDKVQVDCPVCRRMIK